MTFATNQETATREYYEWLIGSHRVTLALLVAIAMESARPDIASGTEEDCEDFSPEERESVEVRLTELLWGEPLNHCEDLFRLKEAWRFIPCFEEWAMARNFSVSFCDFHFLGKTIQRYREWERNVSMLDVTRMLLDEEFREYICLA